MDEILKFLLTRYSFLYNKYKFKFIDSEVSESFGNAYLTLTSGGINICFVRDKGQIFLEFQSKFVKNPKSPYSWYSIDLIKQLITHETECSSLMDENNAKFLENNIETIFKLFSTSRLKETLKELNKLAKIRSEKLFGNNEK